jgi:hypothetical protein
MRLYKYISSEVALKNIVDGKIKFATISSLNDPTELLPRIYEDELLRSLHAKRDHGYNEDDLLDLQKQEALFRLLSPETMVVSAPKSTESANALIGLPIYDNIDYLKKKFNQTVELMSSRCGIFCLSTCDNSLPMWAHYANNANGFVIEFQNLQDYFSGDNTGILNMVRGVDYKEIRTGVSFDSGSYSSIFFEKDSDWSYEQGKRVVVELSSCEQLLVDGNLIYFKNIDKNLISRVILGWKIPLQRVTEISDEIRKINPNIEISSAKVIDGRITTE